MAELGTKHTCEECETKFYDLGKPDAACPQCGTEVSKEAAKPQSKSKSKKSKKSASTKKAKAKASDKDDDDSSADGEEE